MKKKHSRSDYIQSRNACLRNEFMARLGKKGGMVKDIYKEIADLPAPRFYISEERAYVLLLWRRMSRNVTVIPRRQELIEELERRVGEIMEENPGMVFKHAVFEAVNSPAPSFYLTPKSVKTILHRERHQRYA